MQSKEFPFPNNNNLSNFSYSDEESPIESKN